MEDKADWWNMRLNWNNKKIDVSGWKKNNSTTPTVEGTYEFLEANDITLESFNSDMTYILHQHKRNFHVFQKVRRGRLKKRKINHQCTSMIMESMTNDVDATKVLINYIKFLISSIKNIVFISPILVFAYLIV